MQPRSAGREKEEIISVAQASEEDVEEPLVDNLPDKEFANPPIDALHCIIETPIIFTILFLELFYIIISYYFDYFLMFPRKDDSVVFTLGRSIDGRFSGKGEFFQKFEP